MAAGLNPAPAAAEYLQRRPARREVQDSDSPRRCRQGGAGRSAPWQICAMPNIGRSYGGGAGITRAHTRSPLDVADGRLDLPSIQAHCPSRCGAVSGRSARPPIGGAWLGGPSLARSARGMYWRPRPALTPGLDVAAAHVRAMHFNFYRHLTETPGVRKPLESESKKLQTRAIQRPDPCARGQCQP